MEAERTERWPYSDKHAEGRLGKWRVILLATQTAKAFHPAQLRFLNRGQLSMKRFLLLFLLNVLPVFGQSNTGELRLSVTDPSGLGAKSSVELVCEANQFQQSFETDDSGNLVAKRLPFGVYRLRVQRSGFAEFTDSVEIRSAIPLALAAKLSIAASSTSVVVKDSDTLIDPYRRERYTASGRT